METPLISCSSERSWIMCEVQVLEESLDGSPSFHPFGCSFQDPKFIRSRRHWVSNLLDENGVDGRRVWNSACRTWDIGGRSGVIYLIVLGLNSCRNCSCLGAELVEVAAEVGRHVQENFGKGDFVEPKVRKYVSSAWTTDRVTGSIQTNGI